MTEVSSGEKIFGDIETVVSFGIRLPGHPGDQRVEAWLAERFGEIGLHDVVREPVGLPMWTWGSASLDVWADGSRAEGRPLTLAGFPLPYTVPTRGLDGEMVRFDDMHPEASRGRIAVEPLTPLALRQDLVAKRANFSYDPDGAFDDLVQTLPFGPRLNSVPDAALSAGAAGYVGLLTGFPWETDRYYVPYDAAERKISALWLSRRRAATLLDLMDRTQRAGVAVRGRLVVEGERREVTCSNIVGRLPGASDETVIVGSHHDGPWASAVEDGSGIALVLAQARYWASVPESERPHNMVFLLTAGHMAGGAGTRSYVERHRDRLGEVVLAVHLEHAAAEVSGDGEQLSLTGEPEPRWWFTSPEPGLQHAVAAAIEAEALRRSHVLPCEFFGAAPPTDGSALYLAGLPVVQVLAAPVYLFDQADTLDKIHVPSLEPLTRATMRIISSLRGRSAADLRQTP